MIIASCSSDSSTLEHNPEENEKEENLSKDDRGEVYAFNYFIKVKDNEGNNLLGNPKEVEDGYNERNIILKYLNSSDKALFEITKNEDNEVLLNISVVGTFYKNNPTQKMTIQWGASLLATLDYVTYELEEKDTNIYCKKIWINNDLKWEDDGNNTPVLSLEKEKDNGYLPPAKPISLIYPEKVKSDNQFAFNLLKKAVYEDSQKNRLNTFISPLSINIALSMLANGAKNETENEIFRTLESSDYTTDQANEHWLELNTALSSVDKSSSFFIFNSTWYASDFTVKGAFIEANTKYYNATVNSIDFTSKDAVNMINSWCADKTNNKVLAPLESLSQDTKLILINAVTFKSNWSSNKKFDEALTTKDKFYAVDGSIENVNMMHKVDLYKYKSSSYANYLEIPFGNEAYNIVFALPNDGKNAMDIVENIEKELYWLTKNDMEDKWVNLSVPKFKFGLSYDMHNFILPEIGMKTSFTPYADFSGISDSPNLYIGKVIHKTFIEIDESGSEAAAITVIERLVTMGDDDDYPEPQIIDFNINKPFIFSIYEKSTGTILFIGKIGKIN